VVTQVRAAQKLSDLAAVQQQAEVVLRRLDRGEL